MKQPKYIEYAEKVKWFYDHTNVWIEQKLTDWSNHNNSFDERTSLEEWAFDLEHE